MSYTHRILILLVSTICVMGCKKLIQIPPNAPNQIVTSQVFADSTDAVAATVALYGNFSGGYGGFFSGGLTIYPGFSADELVTSSTNPTYLQYYTDVVPVTDDQFWFIIYGSGGIYAMNACIEGVTASTGLSGSLKNQLIGENEVMRAFSYFNMVNLFGGVPLVTTTNYLVNDTLSRASTEAIYDQMITDLKDAQARLTSTYPSSGRARPNYYTATALLAKVYLYDHQWQQAADAASLVINSGLYSLEPNLNNVFLDGSNEAIWQVPATTGFAANYQTSEGKLFVPIQHTIVPAFVISNFQLQAFESGDQRAVDWLDSNLVNSVAYYYPYKYKNGYITSGTNTLEDYMVFRLAEQYLIRAEAEAEGATGNAVADLNIIRNRAGLANYSGPTDQTSLLNAIMHERQVELFCEWGSRWMDLKRTGTVQSVLAAEKQGPWLQDNHAALYPVPTRDIQTNPNLTQNPGY
jgi:hypothetical protein